MKYVVIGAGGTGGCIGSYLAKAGFDVTMIARGAHLAAIRDKGMTVHSAIIGDFRLQAGWDEGQVSGLKACTMEEYENCGQVPDVIFVCVKYYSLPETTEFIRKVAGRDTLVIPILNVFGTGGILQEQCPDPVILDGCIYIFSMIEAPGVICQPTTIFRIFFGYRKGQEKRQVEKAKVVEADLRAAQINAYYTDQILKEALQKFSFVSPMGAAGLYYDAKGADFMVPGKQQETFFTLIREVEKLGNAMGVFFEDDLIEVNRVIMMGMTKDSTTSMQRDVAKGKESEIDGLVHRMVRLAHQYQMELPMYEEISAWANRKKIR